MPDNVQYISYSKIKTLESCSFLFYATYFLNIPRTTNDGAILGNIVHEIIELLANKDKYYDYVNRIVKRGRLTKSLKRLIRAKIFKEKLAAEFQCKAEDFVLTFLCHDFWFDDCKELGKAELEFKINKNYNAIGFIDRFAIFNDGVDDYVIIRDAKTQKQLFTQDEIKLSIQALIYLLAIKQIYPNINIQKSSVEFIMLAHSKNNEAHIQIVKDVYDEDLDGFELYLENIQKKVDNYSYDDAISNYAYDKGWQCDGFKGAKMCGRGKEGQIKKDGTPYWACPVKWGFEYYKLFDGEKFISSSFNKEELVRRDNKLKQPIIKKYKFNGCPRFN